MGQMQQGQQAWGHGKGKQARQALKVKLTGTGLEAKQPADDPTGTGLAVKQPADDPTGTGLAAKQPADEVAGLLPSSRRLVEGVRWCWPLGRRARIYPTVSLPTYRLCLSLSIPTPLICQKPI